MQVLVDTSAFFAFLAITDSHHPRAGDFFERAHRERWRLVSTNTVVVETHALLLRRLANGRAMGLGFLDSIQRGGLCQVERVTAEDERQAVEVIRAHRDKSYSLCDALSFVVAKRLGIDHAVSYDKHFAQWGKLILL